MITTYTLNNASNVLFTNSNIVPSILAKKGLGNIIIYNSSKNSYTLNLDTEFIASGHGFETKEQLNKSTYIVNNYDKNISYLTNNIRYLKNRFDNRFAIFENIETDDVDFNSFNICSSRDSYLYVNKFGNVYYIGIDLIDKINNINENDGLTTNNAVYNFVNENFISNTLLNGEIQENNNKLVTGDVVYSYINSFGPVTSATWGNI